MERRRRSQRACASGPSMLSSSRGSPELRRRSASDAEVSATAEGATGSEAAPLGDRGGRTRGGGRGSAATTSSTGEKAEGAERRGDTPARKPDPEAGRMDHHQLGTGRYQVVSTRAPGPPPGHPGEQGLLSPRWDHAATSGPPWGARAGPPGGTTQPPPGHPREHGLPLSPPPRDPSRLAHLSSSPWPHPTACSAPNPLPRAPQLARVSVSPPVVSFSSFLTETLRRHCRGVSTGGGAACTDLSGRRSTSLNGVGVHTVEWDAAGLKTPLLGAVEKSHGGE